MTKELKRKTLLDLIDDAMNYLTINKKESKVIIKDKRVNIVIEKPNKDE